MIGIIFLNRKVLPNLFPGGAYQELKAHNPILIIIQAA